MVNYFERELNPVKKEIGTLNGRTTDSIKLLKPYGSHLNIKRSSAKRKSKYRIKKFERGIEN